MALHLVDRRRTLRLLLGLHLIFGPIPLMAQSLPGQPRERNRLEVERARYRALMLGRVTEVLEDWQNAWDSDDVDGLAEVYSESAFLLMPDGKRSGRSAIRAYFNELLPTVGPISFAMTDFEAGSPLNLVLSSFLFTASRETRQDVEVEGYCVTVLMEEDGAWKIRSQVFLTPSDSRESVPALNSDVALAYLDLRTP